MIKTMSRLMVATAAASMAFAPIAVQANTRAADNAPVYTSATAEPGIARAAEGEELRGASGILITLLAAAAAIAGIIAISDSDDEGQSPGT